jgi:hypothetical protein
MGARMRFGMTLLVPLLVMDMVAANTGCVPGGCFSEADAVQVSPATSCLKLEVGTICGEPDMEGSNGCSETLFLPPQGPGGQAVRVEPGASTRYTMKRDSPGIRIISAGDNRNWVISALLGEQAITITVPIHEID